MTSYFSPPLYFDSDGGRYSDYIKTKKPNSIFVSHYIENEETKVMSISFKANLKEDRLRIAIVRDRKCLILIDNLEFLDQVINAIEFANPKRSIDYLISADKEHYIVFSCHPNGNRVVEIIKADGADSIKSEIDLNCFDRFFRMVKGVKRFVETKEVLNENRIDS